MNENKIDDTTPTTTADEHQQQSPPIIPPATDPPAPLIAEQLTEITPSNVEALEVFATEMQTPPAPEPLTSPSTILSPPPVTEALATPATMDATKDTTPPTTSTRSILKLIDYLTAHVSPPLRDATYRIIRDAVKAGKVRGLVHPSKEIMEVVKANGKTTTRQYPQVLLKSTPELAAQLDMLCAAAARAEMIRTGGRHMTAKEIAEHADPAVFDALIAAGQKWQAARKKRSAYELKRRKAKRRAS
jgi:hypothetical protein